jgi:hypothetical protein
VRWYAVASAPSGMIPLMAEGPVGFWSYVHADNDAVDGAILHLRQLIVKAYSIITGGDLTLFVDTEINWGEEWEKRIADSIAGTTFFIPVITPRFFKSKACRQEVIDFTTKAETSGLNELFLPILYVDVPFLSKDADDPVVRLVAKTQYIKWNELRLLEPTSSEHRTAAHELAVEIERISREVADKPESDVSPTDGGESDDEPDDNAPGTLDLIAQAEEALPAWNQTVEDMARCLDEIGEIPRKNQANLDRVAKQSKMGPRLAVIRKTATELQEPSQRFLDLATAYASQLIEVNAGIDALIHLKPYSEMEASEQAEFLDLADSVRHMRDLAAKAFESAADLSETFSEIGSLSRDMRKPSSTLQRGIERMGDVQSIFDEWVKGFEESGVWDEPGASD